MAQIDVAEAHGVTTGDPSVVVGVLDSGISSTIPTSRPSRQGPERVLPRRRRGHLRGGVDADELRPRHPRGRHDRGRPEQRRHRRHRARREGGSVKVVNDDGFIYPEAAVCGFMWAATHGMAVTNNSFFIDPWEFNCRNDARQRPACGRRCSGRSATRTARNSFYDAGEVNAFAAVR